MADNQAVNKGSFLDHLTKGLYDAVVQAKRTNNGLKS